MRSPVKTDTDFLWSHINIGWHVYKVAEDLACLGLRISTHSIGDAPVETAGHNQEGHVEIDLESHHRGEGVDVKESNGIG